MLLAGALILTQLRVAPAVSALIVVVAFLFAHRVAYRDTDQDRGARSLLRNVWITAPGHPVSFWSTSGRAGQ